MPLSEPPLQVVETGPDAVPAELPVLAGMPPEGPGQSGMVTWLGCGGFAGEVGGLGARPVGGGGVGARCCGAWAPDRKRATISSIIIEIAPASWGRACAAIGVVASPFARLRRTGAGGVAVSQRTAVAVSQSGAEGDIAKVSDGW